MQAIAMTKEEALGTLWAKALGGTFEHLRKFLAVYLVMSGLFGSIATATWTLLLRPAMAAEMKQELSAELNAPCLKDEFGEREDTLACRLAADAEHDKAQTTAIQDLNKRFDEYVTQQAETELRRAQETGQIIKLLEGLQPQ